MTDPDKPRVWPQGIRGTVTEFHGSAVYAQDSPVLASGDLGRVLRAILAVQRHHQVTLRRIASVNDETVNVHLGEAGTILNMLEGIERRWDEAATTSEPEPDDDQRWKDDGGAVPPDDEGG